jgi:hypothetical protein
VVALGLASLGALAAGCGGGGSSPGVASLGSTTTTTSPSTVIAPKGTSGTPTQQLRYVKCLQSHGVPGFPDPGPDTAAVQAAMAKIDFRSPQFQRAMHTCEKYIPQGAPLSPAEATKVQARALKFAKCMRAHGETDWPDPAANGSYVIQQTGAAAQAPVYRKAAKACDPLLSATAKP